MATPREIADIIMACPFYTGTLASEQEVEMHSQMQHIMDKCINEFATNRRTTHDRFIDICKEEWVTPLGSQFSRSEKLRMGKDALKSVINLHVFLKDLYPIAVGVEAESHGITAEVDLVAHRVNQSTYLCMFDYAEATPWNAQRMYYVLHASARAYNLTHDEPAHLLCGVFLPSSMQVFTKYKADNNIEAYAQMINANVMVRRRWIGCKQCKKECDYYVV